MTSPQKNSNIIMSKSLSNRVPAQKLLNRVTENKLSHSFQTPKSNNNQYGGGGFFATQQRPITSYDGSRRVKNTLSGSPVNLLYFSNLKLLLDL